MSLALTVTNSNLIKKYSIAFAVIKLKIEPGGSFSFTLWPMSSFSESDSVSSKNIF